VISRLLLLTVALPGLAPSLSAQARTQPISPQKLPQLKLEVVPAEQTYGVGEPVVVKYRFTNLSDKTVCFPPPAIKSEDETEGYIRAWATNIDGEREIFLEGFYPRGVTDQQLLNEANENWIKLAPGLSYITEAARPVGSLAAGNWKVQSRYIPPDLHGRAKLIIDALGCSPPEVAATSNPARIMIPAAAQNH
jgi:hypothetical protein